MRAWAVVQAADASLAASESMEMPTAVKLTMLFSTFFQASSASAAQSIPSVAACLHCKAHKSDICLELVGLPGTEKEANDSGQF